MNDTLLKKLTTTAAILALMVVMLGAYTRLTHAGLGCPDWPGCYGHILVPSSEALEPAKAWTEMIHRYCAGLLLMLVFTITTCAVRRQTTPKTIPLILSGLILFQACLGMWTVTLKLLPIVVMTHLLGGILIFALLCRFRLQISNLAKQTTNAPDLSAHAPRLSAYLNAYVPRLVRGIHSKNLLRIGVFLVFLQIALGGWVSANYAGIACIGFPRCNGVWVPDLYFIKGFNLFSPIGANYQGGLLEHSARASIMWVHRLGALVIACYLTFLLVILRVKTQQTALKRFTELALILLWVQLTLGVLNVLYLLPLSVAVAHNGVAALLFAALLSSLHLMRKHHA